jgi:superoxide reductase
LEQKRRNAMTEKATVYKCEHCGIIVEVLHAGGGALTCCGEDMKRYTENTTDAATEKHVPVVELTDGGLKVTVGSVAHPMEDAHFIEWIEWITADGKALRQDLNPGAMPEAFFAGVTAEGGTARAYCNLHGLWKS